MIAPSAPAVPRVMGKYCGYWTLTGPAEERIQHLRFRCKSYNCPRCGPRKARRVRGRIMQHSQTHNLQRMLTLTLDPKKTPPGATQKELVQFLRELWRKMRVYLKRKLGRSPKFIAVLEFQKNGNPHLHVLLDSYLPKEWLLHSWQSLGGGFTDIRFVDVKFVAAYLAKYMTKAWREDFPKGCRRITASRGLVFFERKKSDGEWQLHRQTIEQFFGKADQQGIPIHAPEFRDEDGVTELVRFETEQQIPYNEPRFGRMSSRREWAFLQRTGRRLVGPRLRVSPSGKSEIQPKHVRPL